MNNLKETFLGPLWENLQGETIVSLFIIFGLIVLFIIVGSIFRRKNKNEEWKKPDKGFSLFIVLAVEKIDGMVENLMGPKYKGFGGYVFPLTCYIGLSFIFGLMGFPNPMSYFGNTFAIALCTFLLIHGNAVRANKWAYFHRYIEPFPFLLPINLLSMWAPLLSLSLRIFGNSLSGYTIMGIMYWALSNVSAKLFSFLNSGASGMILPPILTWIFHGYFDAFSGLVQTLIFIMLTMILIAQEDPDPSLA